MAKKRLFYKFVFSFIGISILISLNGCFLIFDRLSKKEVSFNPYKRNDTLVFKADDKKLLNDTIFVIKAERFFTFHGREILNVYTSNKKEDSLILDANLLTISAKSSEPGGIVFHYKEFYSKQFLPKNLAKLPTEEIEFLGNNYSVWEINSKSLSNSPPGVYDITTIWWNKSKGLLKYKRNNLGYWTRIK